MPEFNIVVTVEEIRAYKVEAPDHETALALLNDDMSLMPYDIIDTNIWGAEID